MAPAAGGGAQAEIVFLAVAAAERSASNRPTSSSAARRIYMQKPTVVGHLDTAGRRWPRGSPSSVPTGRPKAGCRPRCGIAADRRVVGERRDRGDPRLRIGVSRQPGEPAGRHLGVAVQQRRRRARRPPRIPALRGCDEAEIAPVAQQHDASGRLQRCRARRRAGSGEQSSTTMTRPAGRSGSASTASRQRRVSARPR